MARRNNAYTISLAAPLIRPGIIIETTVSERYVIEIVAKLMAMVREINESDSVPPPPKEEG